MSPAWIVPDWVALWSGVGIEEEVDRWIQEGFRAFVFVDTGNENLGKIENVRAKLRRFSDTYDFLVFLFVNPARHHEPLEQISYCAADAYWHTAKTLLTGETVFVTDEWGKILGNQWEMVLSRYVFTRANDLNYGDHLDWVHGHDFFSSVSTSWLFQRLEDLLKVSGTLKEMEIKRYTAQAITELRTHITVHRDCNCIDAVYRAELDQLENKAQRILRELCASNRI